ncbi:hypothetical protein G6514_000752 [Epicoccum nigrum]|nr:hypothetical protein G6514_000752 [Epicoccum nigrum]
MTVEDMNQGDAPHESECSLLNFIYACSLCGATFADTYEGHNETVQGFSDGINPKDRLVTKLYLSGCCHVFCGEHIEGGAPPFHPAGQKPRAPCPFCIKDKGDYTERDLYSIRGFQVDEHDPAIPPIWFTAPPMSLDGRTREMEALRFQYLALARYCQTSYRTQKPLADALEHVKQEIALAKGLVAEGQSKIASLQYENRVLQAAAQQAGEVEALRAEIRRLQHLELERNQFDADLDAFRRLEVDVRNLDTFRKYKAAILHYMKLLPTVVEQNKKMKERLASLGFAMAVEPVPNYTQLTSDDMQEIESIADACTNEQRHLRISPSSHTAGRSANTSGYVPKSQERPLKRQRVDSPLPHDMQIDAPSSRDIMPPPAKPLSRMRSVRGLLPTIRKKLTSSRSSPKDARNSSGKERPYRKKINSPGNQPTDQKHWGNGSEPHNDERNSRTEVPCNFPTQRYSTQSHGMGLAGAKANIAEFSFRAQSPVKMLDRTSRGPVQLPNEPSYLHLMDGLSYDNGIKLDLKDPRIDTGDEQRVNTITTQSPTPTQEDNNDAGFGHRSRWALGHAFLHQSPNGVTRASNGRKRSSPQKSPKGFFSRAYYDPSIDTDITSPPQLQRSARQTQDVFTSFRQLSVADGPTFKQSKQVAQFAQRE